MSAAGGKPCPTCRGGGARIVRQPAAKIAPRPLARRPATVTVNPNREKIMSLRREPK
jgi:hypothetical protein